MQRQIFIVSAFIVDANGTFNYLPGYPKSFDSRSYGNDIDKAQRRAIGDMSETFGAMCKVDTRQIQTALCETVDGFVIKRESIGELAELPDPEEANEPE